ncbi:MAG: chalcone isomerase family protein [Rhodocyclaceae bacterium]
MTLRVIRRLAAALAPVVLCMTSALAAEVGGVRFDDQIRAGNAPLVLNGAGVRTKLVFKVYAMGLYLPQKADSLAAIQKLDGPKRIELVTLRTLTSDQLSEALVEGLQKNTNKAEYERLASRVETLERIMAGIGKTSEGTHIQIDYANGETRIVVGGTPQGNAMAGDDFFQALLRIWLGNAPAQDDLKEKLLGR